MEHLNLKQIILKKMKTSVPEQLKNICQQFVIEKKSWTEEKEKKLRNLWRPDVSDEGTDKKVIEKESQKKKKVERNSLVVTEWVALREKCSYSKSIWSAFSRKRTE